MTTTSTPSDGSPDLPPSEPVNGLTGILKEFETKYGLGNLPKTKAQKGKNHNQSANKGGRPKGCTSEKMTMKQRLKALKEIALDAEGDERIRMAAIDLYTKLSGDALKEQQGESGIVVGLQVSRTEPKVLTRMVTAVPEAKPVGNPTPELPVPSTPITEPAPTMGVDGKDIGIAIDESIPPQEIT